MNESQFGFKLFYFQADINWLYLRVREREKGNYYSRVEFRIKVILFACNEGKKKQLIMQIKLLGDVHENLLYIQKAAISFSNCFEDLET